MRTITTAELTAILELHKKFLRDEEGGIRANLSGANLSGANLSYANLKGANLSYADLRGADLSEADLSEADLRYADLRRTDLRRAKNLHLQIEDGLLQKIAIAVNADEESLNMNMWHACATTHCIAGWAVTLAEKGKELESKYGTEIAGLMLLGVEAHSHFFDSNEGARAYLSQFLPEELA